MRLHNRQIKATFWSDTDLIRSFSRDGRMFYQGLWQLADDSGCLDDDAFAWKIHLFPGDFDITPEILINFRNKFVEMKKIIPYEAEGKKCIYLANFHKHQTLKNPAPPNTPLPEWIKWQPYPSNNKTGKYIIYPINDVLENSYKSLNENLSNSSNQNQNQNQEPEKEDILSTARPKNQVTPYDDIISLYHEQCPSLPKIQKLSKKRKKAISARFRASPDLECFKSLFNKAEASDFLSGRSGKWTSCNFDWLMNENNMIKVLEGIYDNRAPNKNNNRIGANVYDEFRDLDDLVQ